MLVAVALIVAVLAYLVRGQETEGETETDTEPIKKRIPIPIRCRRLTCNFATKGIGKAIMMKSVRMLKPAFA